MGLDSTGYKIVFVLHILSLIFGFGPFVLNGLYGAQAKKRPGVGGLAIGEATFEVGKVAQIVIYTVPIWGIGLLGMSDGVWEFSQLWVWLSLVLYVVAVGISHAVMKPSAKRMNVLAAEMVNAGGPPAGGPPPQVVEMEGIGKKLAVGGTVLNLLLVTILVLMVFKPGGP